MRLNLSYSQIAQELEFVPDSAHDMATPLRQRILVPQLANSDSSDCEFVWLSRVLQFDMALKLATYAQWFPGVRPSRMRIVLPPAVCPATIPDSTSPIRIESGRQTACF